MRPSKCIRVQFTHHHASVDGWALRHRCRVDAEVALTQLLEIIGERKPKTLSQRVSRLTALHESRAERLDALELKPSPSGAITVPFLLRCMRNTLPTDSLILNESITSFGTSWTHLRRNVPDSMFTSGGAALGYGLGAAIGAGLAKQEQKKNTFLCVLIGDGSFLFNVPSVAFWMAKRCKTPALSRFRLLLILLSRQAY